jgi:hypothetical protein
MDIRYRQNKSQFAFPAIRVGTRDIPNSLTRSVATFCSRPHSVDGQRWGQESHLTSLQALMEPV